MVGKSLL
jgi:hypothetical protein